MNIYDKISRMPGIETFEQKMYMILSDARYNSEPYMTCDKGEEMSLIHRLIWSWWKPRFLLDHRTRCAYELMSSDCELITVTDNDIDWDSLKGIPEEIMDRARTHDAFFPTIVYGYRDGIASVEWQINPDGRYYEDDDGFGATNDIEVALWGKIDR